MSKLLLLLSFTCLAILILGTALVPQAAAFWLADGSANLQLLRIILAVFLLGDFITNPPRNIFFRLVAGVAALMIGGWALQQTYSNHMQLLDSLSLLAAAVTIGVTALELEPETKIERAGV